MSKPAVPGRAAPPDTLDSARYHTVRLYRINEAMDLLSMSRSVIYEQIRAGRLRSVTQGRSRFIPASAITDYVDLLVAEARRADDRPA